MLNQVLCIKLPHQRSDHLVIVADGRWRCADFDKKYHGFLAYASIQLKSIGSGLAYGSVYFPILYCRQHTAIDPLRQLLGR